jgi:hypothetical protein
MPPASAGWTGSATVTGSATENVSFDACDPYFVIENSDLRGNTTAIVDNSPSSTNKKASDNMT